MKEREEPKAMCSHCRELVNISELSICEDCGDPICELCEEFKGLESDGGGC